ncbi:MAG: nucleotide exchange factor GrpE, partial [Bordetella sp.]|nr:nucleotide exchange factor GrpE [Bordetella sp.]
MNDINDETRDQLEQDIKESEADAAAEGADGDMAVVDALIAERDQWKDRALRAVAEAENVKRRAEAQQNDARAYAIQRFAKDLLSVA